jgi:hypothetical protein
MKLFGFDLSDPAGLQNAVKAAEQAIRALAPVIAEAENRVGGIGESLLDRLDGATLTLKLKEIPKATAANPDPDAQ